jgi:Zn-dependent M28 family amino/carboxypeptidase
MIRVAVFSLLALSLLAGCSGPTQPPEFNGDQAYQYLKEQVAFGPRVPGTEAWADCRQYFYDHFSACGFTLDSNSFEFLDPYSHTEIPLVNVIARYEGDPDDNRALLMLAHYDSRPRTDYHSDTTRINEPIAGANDGASGVAVLMELARLVAEKPPDCNLTLVLSDGEDWGKPGDTEYYLLGAREFARQGIRAKYHFGVVVDMVGDKVQQIYREEYSNEYFTPLNDMIWQTAAKLGIDTFHDSVRHTVMDDHLELAAGGVPTVVIIDFDYPYWHTEQDTPDKCSPVSLANVGRVLAYIVYNRSIWPNI